MGFLTKDIAKTFAEAKLFLKDMSLHTERQYNNWIKGKSVYYRLPTKPMLFYKNEWINWSDYLNSNNISLKNKEFYSYIEASRYIINNGISSKRQYAKFFKNDSKLPSNPDIHYEEWTSWEDFTGREKIKFISFEESKEYVQKLKLKSVKEWIQYRKDNNINFIPAYPNDVYKEWISWGYWLGNNNTSKRVSNGSKKIENFLINRNIKYTSEKKFHDCKRINFLYFDFYLPEHNICLEYDGIQHYTPIDRFGGKEGLRNQKIRDHIKDNYCEKNNIKLIRIPFWEESNIETILNKIFNIYKK
jgi:very-short-patch-repair endonuclease